MSDEFAKDLEDTTLNLSLFDNREKYGVELVESCADTTTEALYFNSCATNDYLFETTVNGSESRVPKCFAWESLPTYLGLPSAKKRWRRLAVFFEVLHSWRAALSDSQERSRAHIPPLLGGGVVTVSCCELGPDEVESILPKEIWSSQAKKRWRRLAVFFVVLHSWRAALSDSQERSRALYPSLHEQFRSYQAKKRWRRLAVFFEVLHSWRAALSDSQERSRALYRSTRDLLP